MSCAADGLQVDAVVGATGDASHQAVGVQGVALGMSVRGHEGGDVGAGAPASWPGHVSHGLGDLGHMHRHGAAGTSGREEQNNDQHRSACVYNENNLTDAAFYFEIQSHLFPKFYCTRADFSPQL